MENKETLKRYADFISEEQAAIVVNLLNGSLFNGPKYKEFIFDGDTTGIDPAIPQGLFDKIINITGSEAMPRFAYSYQGESFGRLVNTDRMFIEKLYKTFR
jgi:hypothetical protein